MTSPTAEENRRPGSQEWQLGRSGFRTADDMGAQIKGYASAISVNLGERLTFFVSVSAGGSFSVAVHRIGWYGGLGGRLVAESGTLRGIQQAPAILDSDTGRIHCEWQPSWTLEIPEDWVSGIHLALLTDARGFQNYVFFVVRDDARPSAFLHQAAVATYQAYNNWPNTDRIGKSLYWDNSVGGRTVAGCTGAVKVSFDRPFARTGAGSFLDHEINFVRWLERQGLDVTYGTDVDAHLQPERLLAHRAILSASHAEYWSASMRDGWERARDAGVCLGSFGGNTCYWQVRFEDGGRSLVCYREAELDPVGGGEATVRWRDAAVGRPEQLLLGNQTNSQGVSGDLRVQRADHWAWRGTGVADGDVIPGVIGYEVDAVVDGVPLPEHREFTVLGRSPIVDAEGQSGRADSVLCQAPSGAWVFAAGSIWWSWGLDDYRRGRADARLQRMSRNLLDRFAEGAG